MEAGKQVFRVWIFVRDKELSGFISEDGLDIYGLGLREDFMMILM